MENNSIRNKIIALSGEPVSGKSTIVKVLVKKLKELGYTDEHIHLEATGKKFREYFNLIISLINNLNDKEALEEMKGKKELESFFENKEYRKILSTSIANLIKNSVNLSEFTIEKANNSDEFENIRKIVDTLIDSDMEKKGREINAEEHPDDIWIIDSRLAFSNIPEAFSVRLTTNADVAAERLFNDKSRGKEDSQYKTIEDAKREREERRNGENNRYLSKYGVDLKNEDNYDLIIDTSYSTPSDIADVILQCEKRYEEHKEFSKKWASPKLFLPLQTERSTLESSAFNFEEMLDSIKKLGYIPSESIEVVNVDGLNYIIEGHHRNFAAAYLGKTLIPYEVIAKDDEEIPKYRNTARNRAESIELRYLYGHEWFIQEADKEFSYSKMFPELLNKLKEQQEQEDQR